MARSSGFRPDRARTKGRRLTSWEDGPGGTTVSATQTGPNSFFLGSGVSLVAGVAKLTVVRIRGEALFQLATADALGSGFSGAFGIGIASLSAVTAGVGSVPTPITEAEADNWLYHRFFSLRACAAIVAADAVKEASNLAVAGGVLRFEVDSKAMRIISDEDSLYAICEIVEDGVATSIFDFNSRMLVKLS